MRVPLWCLYLCLVLLTVIILYSFLKSVTHATSQVSNLYYTNCSQYLFSSTESILKRCLALWLCLTVSFGAQFYAFFFSLRVSLLPKVAVVTPVVKATSVFFCLRFVSVQSKVVLHSVWLWCKAVFIERTLVWVYITLSHFWSYSCQCCGKGIDLFNNFSQIFLGLNAADERTKYPHRIVCFIWYC